MKVFYTEYHKHMKPNPWCSYQLAENIDLSAPCYYETQKDCWERSKALARKARGRAVLLGKNGNMRLDVTYG